MKNTGTSNKGQFGSSHTVIYSEAKNGAEKDDIVHYNILGDCPCSEGPLSEDPL